MVDVPKPPTVIASVPTFSSSVGVLPIIPSVVVFPVAGPPGPEDASGLAYIRHNGTSYAIRSTVTLDPTRVVVWIGPVPPAIDGTYALNNVDVWWDTDV